MAFNRGLKLGQVRMGKSGKNCDYCQSEEGKPRPIGQYVVILRTAVVEGELKYACQGCMVSNKEFLHALRIQEGNTSSSDGVKSKTAY
ncbi:MAG: hypothetical protein ABJG33_10480 [Balneola sp.]